MDKKILGFLFKLMVAFFLLIFAMGFFSEVLKPVLLPNVNVAAIGNTGIKRRAKQTGQIEPLYAETLRCLEDVEVLEVRVKRGEFVVLGDPLLRVRIRADQEGNDRYQALQDAFNAMEDQMRWLVQEMNRSDEEAWRYQAMVEAQREELETMEGLYEIGLISNQNWRAWQKQLESFEVLWAESSLSGNNQSRWKEEEADILAGQLERAIEELAFLRSQCTADIDDQGWIYAPFDGIVTDLPNQNQWIQGMEALLEIGAVSDYRSVKLVTEISISDYRWVGDNLLVYVRTSKGLLKTYTDNIYQTSHGTVVFESLFNKPFDDDIRIGQSYETMIEEQQYFMGTITIPKTLISAPGGFYNRGIGTVKIIRQESGILGDEYFVDQVPIRMVVVGDERVITLPVGELFVLNGDDLEPGTKVFIDQ